MSHVKNNAALLCLREQVTRVGTGGLTSSRARCSGACRLQSQCVDEDHSLGAKQPLELDLLEFVTLGIEVSDI